MAQCILVFVWVHVSVCVHGDMCTYTVLMLYLCEMVAMPAAGVVNNPGCPYKVGRQCGACGVLAP